MKTLYMHFVESNSVFRSKSPFLIGYLMCFFTLISFIFLNSCSLKNMDECPPHLFFSTFSLLSHALYFFFLESTNSW